MMCVLFVRTLSKLFKGVINCKVRFKTDYYMDMLTNKQIVIQALELSNQSRSNATQIPISDTSILFGQNGHLDSMALVALLMDIEDAFQEQGIDISLSDEKAMSLSRSPFKDIPSMTQYIHDVIAAQS
jgi:acyl carrier protein